MLCECERYEMCVSVRDGVSVTEAKHLIMLKDSMCDGLRM